MSKSHKKNAKKARDKTSAEVITPEAQALAQAVTENDEVEVLAEVDIDNKVVADVLIVRDVDADASEAELGGGDEVSSKIAETTGLDEKLAATTDKLKDDAEQLKDGANTLKAQALTKIEDISNEFSDKLAEKTAALHELTDNAKTDAQKAKQSLLERTETAVLTGAAAVHDELNHAKDKLSLLAEEAKSTVSEKIDGLDDKFDAKQKLGAISENTALTGELIKDELTHLKATTSTAITEAKQAGEAYSQTHSTKGLSGKLGMVGAYLSGWYAGERQNKQFTGVDLSAESFEKDAFHAQSSSLITHLLGPKGATAKGLASKVVPQSKFEAISEGLFNKVAQWAGSWALKDLQKDARFNALDSLSELERDAFAQEVADQNRALATLGGVAGFAGIKGLVADMGWLLLVSLRTVYQLAAIYDKPLTGKAGIKQAYGVLSGANLEKMQEKQVLLTALALGNTVLRNAQTTGIHSELGLLTAKFQGGQMYKEQIDQLGRYVDLDRFNPSWLSKLLPVTSVAAGAYYNNELISEVIGTAMATFANQKTLANTQDTPV